MTEAAEKAVFGSLPGIG